jgi:hypothetical protein
MLVAFCLQFRCKLAGLVSVCVSGREKNYNNKETDQNRPDRNELDPGRVHINQVEGSIDIRCGFERKGPRSAAGVGVPLRTVPSSPSSSLSVCTELASSIYSYVVSTHVSLIQCAQTASQREKQRQVTALGTECQVVSLVGG